MAASVLGGLVGGLIGAGAMSVAHRLVSRGQPGQCEGPGECEGGSRPLHQPDATVKVAEQISRVVRGRPLAEDEKPIAATAVHYAFGAALGATYGVLAALAPAAAAGRGAGFGVAAYLGPHATLVPALGLAPSPRRQPLATEALELALHVVYGVSVECVRSLFTALSHEGGQPWPTASTE